jgi:hypothetical protein
VRRENALDRAVIVRRAHFTNGPAGDPLGLGFRDRENDFVGRGKHARALYAVCAAFTLVVTDDGSVRQGGFQRRSGFLRTAYRLMYGAFPSI